MSIRVAIAGVGNCASSLVQGVEARDVLAAVAEGANQLESAPTRLARLEEQGLDFADHGSLLVRFSFLLYCDNVEIGRAHV